MSCNCVNSKCQQPVAARPSSSVIATLVKIVIAWVVIVGTAGTLMQANHPVAMEAGKLLHTVSMVDPAIYWADSHDLRPVATGLRAVSQGLPLHEMFAASH